jgi:glycosyltransferase involved in cell wall biosynthesis
MAEGLPCVVTDVGDDAAAVGAAVVVPPDAPGGLAATPASLLTDAGRRAELGARARSRAVAALGAGLMARRTLDVLAGVCARPGQGTGCGSTI